MKSARLVVPAVVLGLLVFAAASRWRQFQESPERAYQAFLNREGVTGEDETMDPLIVAGDKVVPMVIEGIKDKKMKLRGYAIEFLGNGSYQQALPVLELILGDSTEDEYFRSTALQAIYLIDSAKARRHAQIYRKKTDYLGYIAKQVVANDPSLQFRRSYADALMHRHY